MSYLRDFFFWSSFVSWERMLDFIEEYFSFGSGAFPIAFRKFFELKQNMESAVLSTLWQKRLSEQSLQESISRQRWSLRE